MILTIKQIAILKIVIEGNGRDGAGRHIPCDLDQIIDRVDYNPSKEAIQFSIRNLVKKGLIEKSGTDVRRDRRRVLICPTKIGRQIFKAEVDPCFIEPDAGDFELMENIR